MQPCIGAQCYGAACQPRKLLHTQTDLIRQVSAAMRWEHTWSLMTWNMAGIMAPHSAAHAALPTLGAPKV